MQSDWRGFGPSFLFAYQLAYQQQLLQPQREPVRLDLTMSKLSRKRAAQKAGSKPRATTTMTTVESVESVRFEIGQTVRVQRVGLSVFADLPGDKCTIVSTDNRGHSGTYCRVVFKKGWRQIAMTLPASNLSLFA